MMIDLRGSEADTVTAILFGPSDHGDARQTRDKMVDVGDKPFGVTIVMPCGAVVEYAAAADIPRDDVPCPCGSPTHHVIAFVE